VVLSGHTNVEPAAGDTFTAAMTVLVFLLPATGLLGQYLDSRTRETTRLLVRADETQRRSRAESGQRHLRRLLRTAAPLRRAIVYTTAAVLCSAFAMFEPPGCVSWYGYRATTAELLVAVAVSLLIGTAVAVLPATWTVLDYRQTKEYVDEYLQSEIDAPPSTRTATAQPAGPSRVPAAGSAPPQPAEAREEPADDPS
jgi:hypothetical protein